MPLKRLRDLTLASLALLALAACGDKDAPKPATPGGAPAATEGHEAPRHGGQVLEMGEEEGHVEMVHDEKAGAITLYVYGSGTDKPLHVAKPSLSVQAAAGPVDVPLEAVDSKDAGATAHTWKATHAALKAEPIQGRIHVTIGGKQLQSEGLEPAGHTHK